METSKIEKLDNERYRLLKWLTVGWATWFGANILKDLINGELIMLEIFIWFVGFVVFIINLQKYIRLASKVKNSRLRNALNNEMHQIYKYKSVYVGFNVVLATVILFFILSLFQQIPAKSVCEITLYVGVLSSLIAGLIYNRD
jgi:hypothetical protein